MSCKNKITHAIVMRLDVKYSLGLTTIKGTDWETKQIS